MKSNSAGFFVGFFTGRPLDFLRDWKVTPMNGSNPNPPDDTASRVREFIDLFGLLNWTDFISSLNVEMLNSEPSFRGVLESLGKNKLMASILTTKVLAEANSAWLGARVKIDSLNMALTMLGTDHFYHLAVRSALRMGLGESGAGQRKVWSHASHVADVGKKVAQRIREDLVSPLVLLAYLHDCAIPLMTQKMSDYVDLIDAAIGIDPGVIEIENSHYHFNHALLASTLAELWKFPPHIIEAVRHHHTRTLAIAPAGEARTLVALLMLTGKIIAPPATPTARIFSTPADVRLLEEMAVTLNSTVPRLTQIAVELSPHRTHRWDAAGV